MALTLKMLQLVNMSVTLQRISSKTNLPVKTSFRLGRLVSLVQPDLERFEKHRLELIKKHGNEVEMTQEQIDNGEQPQYRIPARNTEAFNNDIKSLFDEEVTITSWKNLKLEDFGESSDITPAEFASIMSLIDSEDDV